MAIAAAPGEGEAPQESRKPYVLPARNIFDVITTNDLPNLLTLVRGVNPYDISPGLKLILEHMKIRPETPNPYVEWTNALDIDDPRSISEARDSQGNSALHVAARLGHKEAVQALVQECFCDVHAFNKDGMTPLHLAALCGRLECVKLLSRYGADPLVLTKVDGPRKSMAGRTTMFLAHWNQHHAVVQFLEQFFGLTKKKDLVEELGEDIEVVEGGVVKKVKPPTLEPPFATLSHAARAGNCFCFAKMFDFIDCMNSVVGILPVRGAEELLCHLRTAVPQLLPLLLPKEIPMSPEKRFIFRGLHSRGFIPLPPPEDVLSPAYVVDIVLKSAQVEAFRILFEAGLEIPRENSFALTVPKEDWADNLRVLIHEVEIRSAFEDAMVAYRKRHHSRPLKERARYCKKRLECVRREVAKRGLTPFTLPPPDAESIVPTIV